MSWIWWLLLKTSSYSESIILSTFVGALFLSFSLSFSLSSIVNFFSDLHKPPASDLSRVFKQVLDYELFRKSLNFWHSLDETDSLRTSVFDSDLFRFKMLFEKLCIFYLSIGVDWEIPVKVKLSQTWSHCFNFTLSSKSFKHFLHLLIKDSQEVLWCSSISFLGILEHLHYGQVTILLAHKSKWSFMSFLKYFFELEQ